MSEQATTLALPEGTGRRRRKIVLWVLLFVAVGLFSAVLAGMRAPNTIPLDPDNPDRNGLQALHRVLEREGVDIRVVRSMAALRGTDIGADTTVLVVGTEYLSADTGAQLLEHTREAQALLVLQPAGNAGVVLDLPVRARSVASSGTERQAHCDDPRWRDGDTLLWPDTLIHVEGERDRATACFPPSSGYNAGGTLAGHIVELASSGTGPDITLLGTAQSWTNQRITDGANAASGLRLLGQSDRLVWYIPAITDGMAGEQSLYDVLPDAFGPSVVVLALGLGALMFWRGRRLGPVVVEPLPAVIRSVETTQGRSRMYRRAQDRRRALAALQLAARRRLSTRLGLAKQAAPETVVRAVAEHTGRHTGEIHRLLADPSAPDDDTLVRIAREVRSLEEGMRNT